jgi:hypothetical protein
VDVSTSEQLPKDGQEWLKHVGQINFNFNIIKKKLNSVALVRERTIPTERS